jgi:hypothetical protein
VFCTWVASAVFLLQFSQCKFAGAKQSAQFFFDFVDQTVTDGLYSLIVLVLMAVVVEPIQTNQLSFAFTNPTIV